jgi:hypothetical protein
MVRTHREKGILTAGLCVVADSLPVHEAYELAHHRPAIENIKVRPRSFTRGAADDVEVLRNGDFHVLCDAKFDFTRIDEAMDTLGLFMRAGVMPDAITYSRAVEYRVISELARMMLDSDHQDSRRHHPEPHTVVLTGILPEQKQVKSRRVQVLRERISLAERLLKINARVALYGAAVDFSEVEVPDGVMTIGAGIRLHSDDLWGYATIEHASEIGVDIPLVGSVMGDTPAKRREYLDRIAPFA